MMNGQKKIRNIILVAAALFAFSPLLYSMLASGVAGSLGCRVDEGSAHECLLAGHDIGESLYAAMVGSWNIIVTFPAGTLLFIIVLVVSRVVGGIKPSIERHHE